MSSLPRPAAAIADPDLDTRAAAVRRFNRFYTRLLGLLDEQMLDSGFSLTEMRVMYELAQRVDEPPSAAELARELALDAAYLSRILRRFGERGLLARQSSPTDARAQRLVLTRQGLTTFAPLDRASQQQACSLLSPLHPPQRAELVAAMERIETLLSASPPAAAAQPFVLRGLEIGDIGWIIRRQGQLYAQEYGWNAEFEALVAEIAAGFVKNFDPVLERAWIAEREGAVVASVFCMKVNRREAKLRLLYVEPAARGLGLGRRLTDECIRFARDKGYQRLVLWTNDVLTAARRIYVERGFVLEREEHHHSFGHDMVGQYWALDLKTSVSTVTRGRARRIGAKRS